MAGSSATCAAWAGAPREAARVAAGRGFGPPSPDPDAAEPSGPRRRAAPPGSGGGRRRDPIRARSRPLTAAQPADHPSPSPICSLHSIIYLMRTREQLWGLGCRVLGASTWRPRGWIRAADRTSGRGRRVERPRAAAGHVRLRPGPRRARRRARRGVIATAGAGTKGPTGAEVRRSRAGRSGQGPEAPPRGGRTGTTHGRALPRRSG